jgi:uncharacterized protein YaeQ
VALKSTVFKAALQVNDIDRHYYRSHALTLARHPSETDERMMVRLLAFALNADDALVFGNGLSSEAEPDLWLKDLTGSILHWIDVGQPEGRALRQAAGRAERVTVYAYGRNTDAWWTRAGPELQRFQHLAVHKVDPASTQALGALAQRNMRLQCSVHDGNVSVSDEETSLSIGLSTLKPGARVATRR